MNNDRLLRSLDAAEHELTTDQRVRAASLLDQVVATNPNPKRVWTTPRKRLAWRTGGLLAVGAAAATVALVVPGLMPTPSALASWTPQSEAIAESELDAAVETCTDLIAGSDGMHVFFSERRGDLVALQMQSSGPSATGTESDEVFCIATMPAGTLDAEAVFAASSSSMVTDDVAQPVPNPYIESMVATGTIGDDEITMISGEVADDVVGLTVHANGTEVEATIHDGRWGAWWPGTVGGGVPEPQAPTEDGTTMGTFFTYDVTYADGTVVENAPSLTTP